MDASASDGGDGSETAPYTTIQRGLDRAGALGGALVAVAAGTYPETIEFKEHVDIRLAGRCRDLVTLDASGENGQDPGIRVDAGYALVEIAGLTLVDSPDIGLLVKTGEVVVRDTAIVGSGYAGVLAYRTGGVGVTTLAMDGCLIERSTVVGIHAEEPGVEVTLLDTTVRETLPDSNGETGRGIEVYSWAHLTADGCSIEENTDIGVFVTNSGTEAILRDTTVRDTRSSGDGDFGRGIGVQDGANLVAEDCLIEGNAEVGLLVTDSGRATLVDSIVRNNKPDGQGNFGWGVEVINGAMLVAEDSLIEGNTQIGFFIGKTGSRVALRNTSIRNTRTDPNDRYGWGMQVSEGAILSADRCVIEGNTEAGMIVASTGTRVDLRGTTVTNTHINATGDGGRGIEVQTGAILSAEGCLVAGNAGLGLLADKPDTRVMMRNTSVRDGQPHASGAFGWGIQVSDGAMLAAEGCLIEGNSEVGLVASQTGTEVILRDTILRDTRSRGYGGGRGMEIQLGATLLAERCLIAGNASLGLNAGGPGTQVALRETTIIDTQPNAEGMFGRGVQVMAGASLSADACDFEGNTGSGVLAVDPGTRVTLRDSTISGTRSGSDPTASSASGVIAQQGAVLSAFQVDIMSTEGPGIMANAEGTLECVGCSIQGSQFAGAVALAGGILSISDSTIEGTASSSNLLGGAGVYAWDWIGDPPTVTLTNSLIRDNPVAGVWLIGNGTYALSGNTISGGVGEPFGSGSRCGDAILAREGVAAWDGTSGLLLQDNVFQEASGAGIFLDDSSAWMSGNAWSGNTLDLVVQNQSCDALPAGYSEAPQQDLCPFYAHPTCYAEFFFVAMPADPVEGAG